jgi:hypothetical protein
VGNAGVVSISAPEPLQQRISLVPLEFDFPVCAKDSFFERKRHGHLEIAATARAAPRAP